MLPRNRRNHYYFFPFSGAKDCFFIISAFFAAASFAFHQNTWRLGIRQLALEPTGLFMSPYDGEDTTDETPNIEDADWRSFRARLVLGSKEESSSNSTALSTSSSWAYESGHVIEQGSIIVSRSEPDFQFALHQQYFHKSVMLVTDHVENQFTKGIILNRPTNLFLDDDDFLDENGAPFVKSKNNISTDSWRIWFGGDVHGLYSDDPEIVCLHSLNGGIAKNVSVEIIKNVFLTNYEGARKIVDAGEAKTKDFWVFAGYAGWDSGQLMDELHRGSWYMASTDSATVWQELVRQRDEDDADPRDAGLKTWTMLMKMIGKEHEASFFSESFADLTLKEWAAESILFNSTMIDEEIESALTSTDLSVFDASSSPTIAGIADSVDNLVKLALDVKQGKLGAGTLIRGSSLDPSPFLLLDQKFHKSIILLLQDDEMQSVGVVLNHPTTKDHPIVLPDNSEVKIKLRYGGSFGIPGVTDQPIIFLHSKPELKNRQVGEAVGIGDDSKIWICSEDQIKRAISGGHAVPRDFMAVQGFSIWNKDEGVIEGGIMGEILAGKFEVVDSNCKDEIWSILLTQAKLSVDTLERNCRLASDAWNVAGGEVDSESRFVYGTTVKVSELSDDALRYWIEAVLLGGIVSGAKYSAFE